MCSDYLPLFLPYQKVLNCLFTSFFCMNSLHEQVLYFTFKYLQSVLCSLHPGHVFSVGQTISAVFGFFFLILYSSTLAALGPTKYMYLYYVIYTKYVVNTCTCMYLKLHQYMLLPVHTICYVLVFV